MDTARGPGERCLVGVATASQGAVTSSVPIGLADADAVGPAEATATLTVNPVLAPPDGGADAGTD